MKTRIPKCEQCQFCEAKATHEAKAEKVTLKLCKPCVQENIYQLLSVQELPISRVKTTATGDKNQNHILADCLETSDVSRA